MEAEGRLIQCVCGGGGNPRKVFFKEFGLGLWEWELCYQLAMVRDEGGDREGERASQGQLSHSVEVEELGGRGGCAGHTTGQL